MTASDPIVADRPQDRHRRAAWLAQHLDELPRLTAPGQNDAALSALARLMQRLPDPARIVAPDGLHGLTVLSMLELTATGRAGFVSACRLWIRHATATLGDTP